MNSQTFSFQRLASGFMSFIILSTTTTISAFYIFLTIIYGSVESPRANEMLNGDDNVRFEFAQISWNCLFRV